MPAARSEALALVGKLAGGFRVVQHLGSGGTGHVYLAERVGAVSRVRVALKVLRAEHRQGTSLARFQREAHAAARVRHPNVLEIVEAQVDETDLPFFAMELLRGLDLADTLAGTAVLSPARAARIAAAAAEGLAAAHTAGVVHRDVKPENLFLVHAPDGREVVKLVDFGFAWLDGDGSADRVALSGRRVVVGTPEYMAPEQAAGVRGDPRSDIYSLGVVLYEMLAGRAPFGGDYAAIADAHANDLPPPLLAVNPGLTASPEMIELSAQALAKDPSRRFASMAAFRRALLETREGRGIAPSPDVSK